MPTSQCPECGESVIQYDVAAGNGFCTSCGTVVEENTIVAEVGFGETSSGAAVVQGSYVGINSTRARLSGPLGSRGTMESREQTLANANKRIYEHASAMRLPDRIATAAYRYFCLALASNFVKGRKGEEVVATCLYVACRKEKTSHMLIDFSDFLRVNVFDLGHTYLRFIHQCSVDMPPIEPSIYIHRFATLLEFGPETNRVAHDAVRLLKSFDRDWMQTGRRPSGMCGAALLIAARMNNYRRSIQEIVQVVKIADVTLKKRLEEFKKTPSSQLTMHDFRSVWLEDAMDPPAFTQARKREVAASTTTGVAEDGEGIEGQPSAKKRRNRKRRREDDEEYHSEDVEGSEQDAEGSPIWPSPSPSPGPSRLTVTQQTQPTFSGVIDPILLGGTGAAHHARRSRTPATPQLAGSHLVTNALGSGEGRDKDDDAFEEEKEKDDDPFDAVIDGVIEAEVADALRTQAAQVISESLADEERRRIASIEPVDELLGLDEEELDRFILSDDEVRIKEKLWVEFNREYLEKLAAKGLGVDSGAKEPPRKRKKTKPRDSSNPSGATAAESARNMMASKKKFSKKINYAAIDRILLPREPVSSASSVLGTTLDADDDKDDDDKDDDEKDDEALADPYAVHDDNLEVVVESGRLSGAVQHGHVSMPEDDDLPDDFIEGYEQEV